MRRFILFLILAAFVLYTINLKGSLGFFDDTARDTLRALEILKNRELTLIGPPLSIGLFGIREIYFGSLSLYIAAVGLLIAKLDITGAIYPTIFFFTISIYFFYKLVSYLTKSKQIQIISTILYALSPSTVTFARFFWNPNLIIPFSVFFWLLLLKHYSSEKRKLIGFMVSGVIGGVMINFHYSALVLVPLCLFFFLVRRKLYETAALTAGFFIGSLPLIAFELKHRFYLTQAFIYNLTHKGPVEDAGNKFLHFFSGILVVLGLKPSEISHPTINLPPFLSYIAIVVLIFLMVKSYRVIKKDKRILIIPILAMNLVAVYMSKGIYNIHYLFPVYPLLIWYTATFILRLHKVILIFVFFIMFYATLRIPYDVHNIKKDYLSLPKIEEIAGYIARDNPRPAYNITENITGGAQAIPFRFVLLRDAKIQPNDKLSYMDLKTLYVVTADINRTYRENRYEFYATPNKVLTKTVNFGEVKLYKFEAQ